MAESEGWSAALPGDALDPEAMTRRLRGALAPRTRRRNWRVIGAEVLQDEPERSYSMVYTVEDPTGRRRVIARFLGADGAGEMQRVTRLAGWLDERRVRVPRPIGFDAERGMLVAEFVEGRSLAERLFLGGSRASTAAARMGWATAQLHAFPTTKPTEARGATDWLVEASRWEDGLVSRPDRSRFAAILDRLDRETRVLPAVDPVTLHGALAPERFRDVRDRITLLLPRRLKVGDPAADLGNFLALLQVRAAQTAGARDGCLRARPAFLEAYREVGGPAAGRELHRRIRFHEGCSLLRFAGIYATRERWMDVLPRVLLDAAERRLVEGDGK